MKTCGEPGCARRFYARGWCRLHYDRWIVADTERPRSSAERFWAKVAKHPGDGCWEWTGATNGNGYGRLRRNGAWHYAHRFAYEMDIETIPDGMTVDHTCRNRACVRPVHMEVVSLAENIRRGNAIRWHGADTDGPVPDRKVAASP